jgi:hypothetical protein
MTTWASSQFPRPDLHRQDTQPYGLHTGSQDFQDSLILFIGTCPPTSAVSEKVVATSDAPTGLVLVERRFIN